GVRGRDRLVRRTETTLMLAYGPVRAPKTRGPTRNVSVSQANWSRYALLLRAWPARDQTTLVRSGAACDSVTRAECGTTLSFVPSWRNSEPGRALAIQTSGSTDPSTRRTSTRRPAGACRTYAESGGDPPDMSTSARRRGSAPASRAPVLA